MLLIPKWLLRLDCEESNRFYTPGLEDGLESYERERERLGGSKERWRDGIGGFFPPKSKTQCSIQRKYVNGYILLTGFIKNDTKQIHSSVFLAMLISECPSVIKGEVRNLKKEKKKKKDVCIHGNVCRDTIGMHHQSWAAEPWAFIDQPGRSFITTDGVWEKGCNVFVGRCDAWLILCVPHRSSMGRINVTACPNSHDIRPTQSRNQPTSTMRLQICSSAFISYNQMVRTGVKHFY